MVTPSPPISLSNPASSAYRCLQYPQWPVLRSYYTISQDPYALNTWVQLKLVYLDLYFKAFHHCWSSVASIPGHMGGEHVAWE